MAGFQVPNRRGLLALAASALTIAIPIAFLAWSGVQSSLLRETRQTQGDLLAQLQRRLAALQENPGEAADDPATAFLPGGTDAIAGAGLQKRVTDVIAEAAGRLVESEITAPEGDEAEPGRVDLRVTFETEIVALQKVLLELESGRPYLLVRSLDVQSVKEPAENTSPPLTVVMLVGGYREVQP